MAKFDRARARMFLYENPTRHELIVERVLATLGYGRYRFQHPIGRYVADFALLDLGIVVEVDGDSHLSADAQAADREREASMSKLGWSTVRISNGEAERSQCAETIQGRIAMVLESHGPRIQEPRARVFRRRSGRPKSRKRPTR